MSGKKIFFAKGTIGEDDEGSDSGSDNEDKKKKVTIATIPEEPEEEQTKLISTAVEKEVKIVEPPPKQ
jgi:hypothetical protein